MDVPTSEVGYTIATTRRETTEVHKNVWWHWEKEKEKKKSDCSFVSEMGVTNKELRPHRV